MSRALLLLGAGPGGFSPADLPSLKLWLKADALALSDGDPVTTWADSSSSANDFTQSTAAKKPTYQTNEVNGKPVVRFDGVDDALDCSNSSFAQPNMVFVVAKVTISGAYKNILSSTAGVENALYLNGSDVLSLYAGVELFGSGSQAGAFKLFGGLFNGASSKLWVNGVQNGSTGNAGTDGSATLRIGASPSLGNPLPADVAELLFFNANLSDPDRQAVEDYLNGRYGLY